MNFSVIGNGFMNQKVTAEISIDELEVLIRHNKRQEQIRELHTLIKGCARYEEIKSKLPCVKPHGTFNGYAIEENFKKFSGFLFFDIDKGDIDKQRSVLLQKHADKVYMLGKSVGGKGLFFYVKIANPEIITPLNFLTIQNYFIEEVFSDLNIDKQAKGISRNQVIPYDPKLYLCENAVVTVPKEVFNRNNIDVNSIQKCKEQNINKKNKCYTLDFTHSEYVDYNILRKQLILQTPVEFPNNERFIIKKMDVVRVPIWPIVCTGVRHNFFKWQINCLVYLNPNITLLQLESFINFWNEHMTDEPLERKDMKRTVQMEYKRLKEGGTNIAKVKSQLIHTNPNYDNRRATANKVRGSLAKIETKNKMRRAIEQLIKEDVKVNKTSVANVSDISRATVHKYFDEVINDLAEEISIEEECMIHETNRDFQLDKGQENGLHADVDYLIEHALLENVKEGNNFEGRCYQNMY